MLRRILYCAEALALAATVSCVSPPVTVHTAASHVDETHEVTLAGNVHPLARSEFDLGALPAETPLSRMVLVLKTSAARQAELDAIVAAQQDPESPLYHQWISPAEFGARFGAGAADIDQATAWLTGRGFTIDEIPAGNRLIVFSGDAGRVEDAFHVEMHRYSATGAVHIGNSDDPQIPAALAHAVSGVLSLHNFRRAPQMRARTLTSARPQYTAGSTHYLFPADFTAIYDLNPLYQQGTNGAGTTIAIPARSNINLADVAQFRAAAGLPANQPSVVLAGADPGLVKDDQLEATLAAEWSGAAAPAANIRLVVAPSSSTTDGIDLASAYIVNHASAPILSVSYSSCEQAMGAAELAFYNALWEQAASEGISVFVSSGDSGAAGCSPATDARRSRAGVNGLCSSPYATCVGGTQFDESGNAAQFWAPANGAGLGSAVQYIPETVWNESALSGGSGLWASGGGISSVYPQPAWQAQVEGAAAANGMRGVPDVALAAGDHDGSVIFENGSFIIVSGTSVAAPAFAGVMALLVQQQGKWQGSVNPALYAMSLAAPSAFHRTLSGNNSVPGVPGFTASGAAYNLATGLGSVDAAVLAANWNSSSGAANAPGFCRLRLVHVRCGSLPPPWATFP